MKIQKIVVFCCTLVIVLSLGYFPGKVAGESADTAKSTGILISTSDTENSEKLVAENTRFKLYINTSDCNIRIVDSAVNKEWTSNPLKGKDDAIASGIYKTNLLSQLIIKYSNSSQQEKTINSYAASVSKDTYKIYQIDNGVRVEFEFGNDKFVIPVSYVINDKGFQANILFEDITEGENNSLKSISFLPLFGAGSSTDKGLMLVPDGSGALINMNNGKTKCNDYSKAFYGTDLSLYQMSETSNEENLSLAVFGLIKNGSGFLAEVTSGAELTNLEVSIAGKYTSYNRIGTTVCYRSQQTRPVFGTSGTESLYVAVKPVSLSQYSIQYSFINSETSDFDDLADIYRNSLKEAGIKEINQASQQFMNLDVYCGYRKQKSFLGIIHTGNIAVTKYHQVVSMISDLKENGIEDLSINLLQYNSDFFKNNVQNSVTPAGFLGGSSAFKKLINYTKQENINLYVGINLCVMPSSGNGFWTFFNSVSGLNMETIVYKPYALNTNLKSINVKPKYLLKPTLFAKIANTASKSLTKYSGQGIYLNSESTLLYSDFSKKGYQRDWAKEEYIESFKLLSKKGKLSFSNANDYMLPYASEITDVPVGSSGYTLFDEDVPFYQMAIMGSIRFSGKAINLANTSKDYFLSHIESGTAIKYALYYNDEDVLLNTDYGASCGSSYQTYKSEVIRRYKELQEINKKTDGARMVSFERQGLVSVSKYSNGITIYVNHDTEEKTVDGVVIARENYVVK